jgi:type II secretory pathway component GspD/PulD (secretin)
VVEDLQLIPVSTRTYSLNHASANELAALFNATYARKDQNGKIIMPIASSFDGANVVVVTATDKMLSECEAIIKAVDKAIAQIYIEARFIELSNKALHKLGVQWNQLESWGASVHSLNGGMEYNNGRPAKYGSLLSEKTSQSTSQSSPTSNTSVDGDGKTSTTTANSTSKSTSESLTYKSLIPDKINHAVGAGRTSDNMSWLNARGFSGQLSADDFYLAMSAFESMADVKIFSNPKVIVSNGKVANVDMTTKFPNIELSSQRNNSATASYLDMSAKLAIIPGSNESYALKSFEVNSAGNESEGAVNKRGSSVSAEKGGTCFYSWGIQLAVKPRISPDDGLISVEIIPTISQLNTDVTSSGFYEVQNGDKDSSIGSFPIIDMKRITTEFTMKDGATAVIGGLSKTTEEDIDSGIPYLREIPWIGQKLFGWKSRGKVQKEILVFVTVGIADPANLPKDVGLPKNAILGREYVKGMRLEPGDREGAAADALKLDMTAVDKRSPKTDPDKAKSQAGEQPAGTVKITLVNEDGTPVAESEKEEDTDKKKDEAKGKEKAPEPASKDSGTVEAQAPNAPTEPASTNTQTPNAPAEPASNDTQAPSEAQPATTP